MSRRNNGPSKMEHDARETPQALCDAIVDRLAPFVRPAPGKSGPRLLEPSAGAGRFVRAMRYSHPNAMIHSLDIRQDCAAECIVAGATRHYVDNTVEWAAEELERYELICGNPPFTYAEQHIRALLPLLAPDGMLAFLLRINFLGGIGRARGFWQEHPETMMYPIAPRPSFGLNKHGKKGTDGTEYAVFVWERRNGQFVVPGMSRGHHIEWASRA